MFKKKAPSVAAAARAAKPLCSAARAAAAITSAKLQSSNSTRHSSSKLFDCSGGVSLCRPPSEEGTSLADIVEVVRAATEPFADLDESLMGGKSGGGPPSAVGAEATKLSATPPHSLTYQGFAASLVCPKKFYLLQQRRDLIPEASIGDAVRGEDAAGFGELARRWDRLQFGSKAVLVQDRDFTQAVQHTQDVIAHYFRTAYASLGEQAPSLTIHRPAFAAPLGRAAPLQPRGDPRGDAAPRLLLCARPAVLRYRPKENQWVFLEAQAILDPLTTAARAGHILQRIHFSMLAFRYWITQPNIPIAVRKRFLDIDHIDITKDDPRVARVTAPIDLKRSGVLHIRQFFPGPVTLLDCDPPRLMKFIQRLSLEDLLEADSKNQLRTLHGSGFSGAFDLSALGSVSPAVRTMHGEMTEALQYAGHHATARSLRALKKRDVNERLLFEQQQRLTEALLLHHTLPLLEKHKDPQQVGRWQSFSSATADGLAHSTFFPHKKRGCSPRCVGGAAAVETPLIPTVPCYSENIGAHCSRGEVCPFFAEGLCLPQKVASALASHDNHLFTLPSTAVSRKVGWWMEGMRTVRDVLHRHTQGTLRLTAPQLRYARAVAESRIAINPKEIDKFFARLRYPVFIIDFEAAQFALPAYAKVTPHQSVPFQFSLDVFHHDILTEAPAHYDFLHFGRGYSPNVDPRPGLVAELMRVVRLEREKKRVALAAAGEAEQQQPAGGRAGAEAGHRRGRRRCPAKDAGTAPAAAKLNRDDPHEGPATPYDGCFLAHFSSFEKACLEKLGQLEECYKADIKAFYFLDTMELIRKGFVHPNAHGSNSLKKVLPALCPDFQYGVFGSEAAGPADGAASDEALRQDEQKGENAMGIFRLWHHQEGGGTLQDLQRGINPHQLAAVSAVRTCMPAEVRNRVWSQLRIQLLEYCSLDTKALYEIMREIWKVREAVRETPPRDKSGWVYATPTPREVSF